MLWLKIFVPVQTFSESPSCLRTTFATLQWNKGSWSSSKTFHILVKVKNVPFPGEVKNGRWWSYYLVGPCPHSPSAGSFHHGALTFLYLPLCNCQLGIVKFTQQPIKILVQIDSDACQDLHQCKVKTDASVCREWLCLLNSIAKS